MDIRNSTDAHSFVRAWSSSSPSRRASAYRFAAEGMERCAHLSSGLESKRYAAAGDVLRRAEVAAQRER